MAKFPSELKEWKYIIERKAKRAGLDFFTTIFEVVDYNQMNELAAYSGFPARWSHWKYGQEYEELKTFYTYGLQKIYEMVINNDPCYAYLLEANLTTDHKIVIAHVYGHNHFFKNNIWFAPIPRNKLDELANHRYQIEEIKGEVGESKVDEFIDKTLSIEWLIDNHSLVIRREPQKEDGEETPRHLSGQDSHSYMDEWLNPVDYLKKEKGEIEKRKDDQKLIERGLKIPVRPTRDILLFLIEYAPLEQWQKEILAIIREENYYFVPQAQTKIMNEGWAVYWHSKIMTEMDVCEEKEIIDYADHTARTLGGFPYKLGYEIFKDIEYRWDTSRHGKIWEECDIADIKENWDEFAVFKSIFDELKGNSGQILSRWQEFTTFAKAIEEGKCGFPKELCSKRTLIKTWLEYLNASLLLQEQKELLKDAKNTWKKAIEYLEKTRNVSLSDEKKKEAERRYQTRLHLAKQDVREITGNQNYFKILLNLKRAIKEKEILSVSKPIPPGYSEFAQKYPEPIQLGAGREKIFEVTKFYNDLTFIEEFMTEEICIKLQLFTYEPGGGGVPIDHWGIVSRALKKVKQKLLFQFTRHGQPLIELCDANYKNRGELFLKHIHEGMDLDLNYMKDVMKILYEFWQKPVHLETVVTEDKKEDYLSWIRGQMRRGQTKEQPEDEEEPKQKGIRIIFTHNDIGLTRNTFENVFVPEPF